MSTKIGKNTSAKQQIRFKRKKRIRSKVDGTVERPRLAVYRSNKHLYVQLIDDVKGMTLVAATSSEGELKAKIADTVEGAKTLGALVAKRALAKNITDVVFDRGGYLYHGKIKALADGAREGGLQF